MIVWLFRYNTKDTCFPGCTSGKEPTCQCRKHKRHGLDPWVRKTPWRRARQLILVFLPGESYGQRSPMDGLLSTWSQRVRHNWSDLARTSVWSKVWSKETEEDWCPNKQAHEQKSCWGKLWSSWTIQHFVSMCSVLGPLPGAISGPISALENLTV